MAETTDFNGLPPAGALQAGDVVPIQRGTGADSTKQSSAAAVAEFAADALVAGSGIRKSKASGVTTLESGGSAVVDITTSSTLGLQHADRFIRCNSSSAMTITVPAQATVAWPDGIQLEGAQWGAGAVTFVGASGVTIRRSSKITATTDGQYAPWGLKRVALDEWLLFGQMGSA